MLSNYEALHFKQDFMDSYHESRFLTFDNHSNLLFRFLFWILTLDPLLLKFDENVDLNPQY